MTKSQQDHRFCYTYDIKIFSQNIFLKRFRSQKNWGHTTLGTLPIPIRHVRDTWEGKKICRNLILGPKIIRQVVD